MKTILKNSTRMKGIKRTMSFLFLSTLMMYFNSGTFAQTDLNVPYYGITIYIDYPNYPISVTPAQLDSIVNGVDYQEVGVERTFRKYWYEQSRRNVDMQHDIFYYTAPQPTTYYETIDMAKDLWQDALEFVITNNPNYDWSILTPNFHDSPSGFTPMIISSTNQTAGVGAAHEFKVTLSNGQYLPSILVANLRSQQDINNNLFTLIHESGHGIFGFPDTYDNDDGADNSGGTSFYTLMSGLYEDVEPIGGNFMAEYNWGHIIEPTEGSVTITLRADGDSIVAFKNPFDSNEYFSVEARKNSTIGNSLFPADLGLLIWHTDNKVPTSNRLSSMTPLEHYRHSVEQADGLFDLENFTNQNFDTDIGDIYLPGKEFTNNSIPDSKWWDGQNSGFEITNIELIGSEHVKFTITVAAALFRYDEISQEDWSIVFATPALEGYTADHAFDGDINTYYHVPYGSTEPRPHEIALDLNKSYTINEFFYRANDNKSDPWEGRIKDYEIYISDDVNNWGTAVKAGTFLNSKETQYVLFPEATGRYLKLSAVNSYSEGRRTSIAEINIRGYDPVCSDGSTTDTDNDGVFDCIDVCPGSNDLADLDNDNIPDGCDDDIDGDGTVNSLDECPLHVNKIFAGQCGCEVVETDTDNDGIADCNDLCINDPNKIASGVCGCGVADADTDLDGTLDCEDECPTDPAKIVVGECGCGIAEGTCASTCDAPAWNASTVYSIAGTEVVYNGKLYSNKWYAQGSVPSSGGPWVLLDFCDGGGLDCSAVGSWSANSIYSSSNTEVEHNGMLYSNQWYTQGQEPGINVVWSPQGPCASVRLGSKILNVKTQVIPNPFKDKLTFKFNSYQSTINLTISSVVGNVIETRDLLVDGEETTIDLNNLPSGLYIFSFFGSTLTEQISVIKE